MIRSALSILLLLVCQPAVGQTSWRMETEYPASAIPGEGLTTFAELVKQKTSGAVTIDTSFDAKLGIKSADMLDAVRDGRLEAGDAFAGALGSIDPIFSLASLPFLATSIADARRLADLARPSYERAVARLGQRLLYITPWPPTGLWSKQRLSGSEDLRALTVRAYDGTSQQVLAAAGVKAINLSFADAMPRLRDGSVNAVLSSGDGGAGRRLWEVLPHFTDIGYAMPISLATVSSAALDRLTADQRSAVEVAGRETEARQWTAIENRQAENRQQLRANGVTLNLQPDPALIAALRRGAEPVIESWKASAGPDASSLLSRFLSGRPDPK